MLNKVGNAIPGRMDRRVRHWQSHRISSLPSTGSGELCSPDSLGGTGGSPVISGGAGCRACDWVEVGLDYSGFAGCNEPELSKGNDDQ